jgi:glycosyltransferase involved in cell wall biosynthesis
MNIALFLEQPFDPNAGGVQRSTSKLALILKSNGHILIVISTSKESQKLEVWNGIAIYGISFTDKYSTFKEIIEKENISVVINQAGYSFPLTQFLNKNLPDSTKIINTLRINPLNFVDNHKEFTGLFLKRHKLGFLNNEITHKLILWYHIAKQRHELNYIIKNTNAFVMLSERFRMELYSLAPALQKYNPKIHGIGNPFERPNLQVEKLEKENIILFVGRLNILQKRVDLLLKIWKQLHKSCSDWQFWVVGEGEDQESMKTFCKENKLDRVTFFGKDNPTNYYKKAKLFHMTSAFEGFGNVLVEAQSYGCVPILFNSYSAAQDIVNHNIDGILVKPFDTNAYVTQTQALIDNPKKLQKMALNAFENVNRFSYEATYKKWDTVFKSLK